jgi:hypothetical protein
MRIPMQNYTEKGLKNKDSKYYWDKKLFKITERKKLKEKQDYILHPFVAKCLLMA